MRYVLALLIFAVAGGGQNFPQQTASVGTITASGATCATLHACIDARVNGASFVGVQVTGTWAATLQFEGTIDCTTWFSVQASPQPSGATVSNTTGNGQWSLPTSGYCSTRVRVSAFTSGTVAITMRPTTI